MSVLGDEILNDPKGKGYGALIENEPGRVCDLLNAKTETGIASRRITSLTILAEADPVVGPSALGKLRAANPPQEALTTALMWLDKPEGLDIGNPRTQAQLNVHVTQGIITQPEADELKNLALQPMSRAEILGLPYITEELLRSR